MVEEQILPVPPHTILGNWSFTVAIAYTIYASSCRIFYVRSLCFCMDVMSWPDHQEEFGPQSLVSVFNMWAGEAAD